MKKCKECKKLKEYSEFYEHRMMKDGHINVCKDCKKDYIISYNIKKSNLELKGKLADRKVL